MKIKIIGRIYKLYFAHRQIPSNFTSFLEKCQFFSQKFNETQLYLLYNSKSSTICEIQNYNLVFPNTIQINNFKHFMSIEWLSNTVSENQTLAQNYIQSRRKRNRMGWGVTKTPKDIRGLSPSKMLLPPVPTALTCVLVSFLWSQNLCKNVREIIFSKYKTVT